MHPRGALDGRPRQPRRTAAGGPSLRFAGESPPPRALRGRLPGGSPPVGLVGPPAAARRPRRAAAAAAATADRHGSAATAAAAAASVHTPLGGGGGGGGWGNGGGPQPRR